jgi:hypothetical protein
MLKRKSSCTCSFCSKILKDPIILPCGDDICNEHLSEKAVLKQKKIKCNTCQKEYQIKNKKNFRSCNQLKMLIESQCYLSEEETGLKLDLEASIRKFYKCYDEFTRNKTQLESEVLIHFDEMRSKINEHREDLKKQIDDIALKLINKTNKQQDIYLNDLNDLKGNFASSFVDSKLLEDELNEIEQTFRNPSLAIDTIKEMQSKQGEILSDIQFKLYKLNQFKDNLKTTNEFKPNLSLFNQNETTLFGSIRLNKYSSIGFIESQILNGEKQLSELYKVCEFSPTDKWSLLYRGTRDGFGSHDFHSKCDNHANTLTILKAKGSEFIFGGFTSVDWDSSSYYKSDPNAFIFSLTNKDNKPVKMKVDPNQHQYAIYCSSFYGPIFGSGSDIYVANNANKTMDSHSYLGDSYRYSQYAHGTNEAQRFLAGSFIFQLDEVEVYQKE